MISRTVTSRNPCEESGTTHCARHKASGGAAGSSGLPRGSPLRLLLRRGLAPAPARLSAPSAPVRVYLTAHLLGVPSFRFLFFPPPYSRYSSLFFSASSASAILLPVAAFGARFLSNQRFYTGGTKFKVSAVSLANVFKPAVNNKIMRLKCCSKRMNGRDNASISPGLHPFNKQ